ncbi:MAG TPA: (2Fe-2S) ferredoxin domain-containing protein [Dissulfurispiraceae bacterium]|nr:(2Fe-2S) ferredoxin domain-containing protein [Dissulfurispiraceae bacterium]
MSEDAAKNGKKIAISMCMGSSCYPRGNDENIGLIRHYLKVHNLETCIELKGHRCQENCHLGPNIIFNDRPYHQVNPGMFPATLRELLPYFEQLCRDSLPDNDDADRSS